MKGVQKRVLSLLLVLCLALGVLPGTAWAVSSDFTVENGVLTAYNGSGGNVIIPDGVTNIGGSTFGGNGSVTSVTIPSSVTTISSSAFHHCINLTRINRKSLFEPQEVC